MTGLTRLPLKADVFEVENCPGIWTVCADDSAHTGETYVTTFDGDGAKVRALEYAESKFSEFRLRTPR